jgi:hypothetical protein
MERTGEGGRCLVSAGEGGGGRGPAGVGGGGGRRQLHSMQTQTRARARFGASQEMPHPDPPWGVRPGSRRKRDGLHAQRAARLVMMTTRRPEEEKKAPAGARLARRPRRKKKFTAHLERDVRALAERAKAQAQDEGPHERLEERGGLGVGAGQVLCCFEDGERERGTLVSEGWASVPGEVFRHAASRDLKGRWRARAIVRPRARR